eukprot:CAMPEP_0204332710 /NCGR_PEP_ID=MMETSP0469-20131031/16663_1 /ASSEMBLY_ACC=CAM_ASM_000384 /TAXON_ID=2969 /ORGANISM="Oxyrrhis marina" /LENGTH=688 /DNA_ID=CAMNT_0051315909 /DNA_START=8 /DNA_END=2077 /DNA_ORIENTATION=+
MSGRSFQEKLLFGGSDSESSEAAAVEAVPQERTFDDIQAAKRQRARARSAFDSAGHEEFIPLSPLERSALKGAAADEEVHPFDDGGRRHRGVDARTRLLEACFEESDEGEFERKQLKQAGASRMTFTGARRKAREADPLQKQTQDNRQVQPSQNLEDEGNVAHEIDAIGAALEKWEARVECIKENQERGALRLGALETLVEGSQFGLEESARKRAKLENVVEFYTDFKCFADDLAGFFVERLSKLEAAERMLQQIDTSFADRKWQRRKKDVVDSLVELGVEEAVLDVDLPSRRARKLRRRSRGSQRRATRIERGDTSAWADGWDTSESSDDGDGESEYQSDRQQFAVAVQKQVFSGVGEEFGNPSEVLQPFLEFKQKDCNRYVKAFIPDCIAEPLSRYAQFELFWWDPMRLLRDEMELAGREVICDTAVDRFGWFQSLLTFSEAAQTHGKMDPDENLVPEVMMKAVVPRVQFYLESVWDPTSHSSTQVMVSLVQECLLFDSDPSKPHVRNIASAICSRFDQALDELVVMPESSHLWVGSDLRLRQMRRACKVASCVLLWSKHGSALLEEDLLQDSAIQHFVLDKIIAQKLLPEFQRGDLCKGGELLVVDKIVHLLPMAWFVDGVPEGVVPLQQLLRDAAGTVRPQDPYAQSQAPSSVDGRHMEVLGKILGRLQCAKEAQEVLRIARFV